MSPSYLSTAHYINGVEIFLVNKCLKSIETSKQTHITPPIRRFMNDKDLFINNVMGQATELLLVTVHLAKLYRMA